MRANVPGLSGAALLTALLAAGCARPRDVPGGEAPGCTPPLVACGAACVDVSSDEAHCGGCDAPCGAEQECQEGACAYLPCPRALTRCGGVCVDLLADEAHCGACGAACSGGRCQLGVCPGPSCAGVLGLPGPPALSAGAAPVAVAAGDLDGDGILDLIVASSPAAEPGEVRTFLGFGSGAFEPGPSLALPTAVAGAALGSVDPDGSLDLAVAVATTAGGIRLHRGDGAGGFAAMPADSAGDVGALPRTVLLADADGDGADDLLVGSDGSGTPEVRLLRNDGTGAFGKGTGPAPRPANLSASVAAAPNALALADLDLDGTLDVVAAHDLGLTVLYRTADGVLAGQIDVPTPRRAVGVAAADLDGDGFPDLAAADPEGNGVFVALAAAAGTAFGAALPIAAGFGSRAIAAADLDGDGRPELVTADEAGGTVTILTNVAASGLLLTATAAVTGSAPVTLAVAPLDGDLFPDVAVAGATGEASAMLGDGAGGVLAPLAHASGSASALALFHADGGAPAALDAALLDPEGDAILVRLGAGDGTFGAAAVHALPADGGPVALAAGDLDGDGDADVAVALRAAGEVAILWGDGAAGFSDPAHAATVASPSVLVAADLDGAGGLDLVASSADELVVLLSTAGGFVAAQATAACAGPAALAAGRVDADALDDVVVACDGSGEVAVLLRDPASGGRLLPPVAYPAEASASGVALADLDGDGDLDVAASARTAGAVVVLLNDGAGALGAGAIYPACAGAAGIAAGDLTGDGIADLAVACTSRGATAVLRGLGAGSFAPPLLYPTGGVPRAIAAADLDGDSAPELASANDRPVGALGGAGLVIQRAACLGP